GRQHSTATRQRPGGGGSFRRGAEAGRHVAQPLPTGTGAAATEELSAGGIRISGLPEAARRGDRDLSGRPADVSHPAAGVLLSRALPGGNGQRGCGGLVSDLLT